MKYLLCSVYNRDTDEFSFPIPYKTKKIAVADFLARVAERSSKERHFDVSDLSLFYIGDYYIGSGKIEPVNKTLFADGSNIDEDEE